MKTIHTLLACLLLAASGFSQTAKPKPSNLSYVDPSIGGVGLILEPTRPTVQLPNQLIRMFPVRHDALDDQVSYFPLTIASHRVVSLFSMMPLSRIEQNSTWNAKEVYNQEV